MRLGAILAGGWALALIREARRRSELRMRASISPQILPANEPFVGEDARATRLLVVPRNRFLPRLRLYQIPIFEEFAGVLVEERGGITGDG